MLISNPSPAAIEHSAASRGEMIEAGLSAILSMGALRTHNLSSHMLYRDLSLTQLMVLGILAGSTRLTMSELAHCLAVSLPSASAIADRLEERGYVLRSRDDRDRRVVSIEMTDKGRAVADEFSGVKRDEMLRLMNVMTDEELQAFVTGIRAVQAAISRLAAPE